MAGDDDATPREQKRAQALRANLKRRKAQQRGRRAQEAEPPEPKLQKPQNPPDSGGKD